MEKTEKRLTNYKLSSDKEEELNSLMLQLLQFCQINKLPMFVGVATSNDKESTEYKHYIYSSTANFINLKDDRIRRHQLIANGFEATPPREIIEFDIGDI